MIQNGSIFLMFYAMTVPSFSTADVDWHRYDDRVILERALSKISEQCSQLGFERIENSDAEKREEHLHAALLIASPALADRTVNDWLGYFNAMTSMANEVTIELAARDAGDALAAVELNPKIYDEARAKYIQALTAPMIPFLNACRSAVLEPFLRENYLTGMGSLDSFKSKAGMTFDEYVANLSKK
jgi:hypothetical protein